MRMGNRLEVMYVCMFLCLIFLQYSASRVSSLQKHDICILKFTDII
jgi:hypothetical protein